MLLLPADLEPNCSKLKGGYNFVIFLGHYLCFHQYFFCVIRCDWECLLLLLSAKSLLMF